MDRWKGKVALVTGASAGIGLEIATLLAKYGMKVIAVATRLDKLQELAHKIKQEYDIDIYPMKCNLRHEDDILKTFKWAIDTFNGIDILINNAGVVFNTLLSETSWDLYYHVMDVNITGLTICLQEFVKYMKGRKTFAHIINIGSIVGCFSELCIFPMNIYPATKFALRIITGNMRNELKKNNLDIKITLLSCTTVNTPMYQKFYTSERKDIPYLDPIDVAEVVISILAIPETIQVNEVILRVIKPFFDHRWFM